MEKVVLLGGDYEAKGTVAARGLAGEEWAAAISAGGDSPAPKEDPNEDACAIVELAQDEHLAVVADAHFGREAAERVVEVLVQRTPALRTAASGAARRAALAESLEIAGARIGAGSSRSACAVLAGYRAGPAVDWISVGDCRGYRVPADVPAGTIVFNPLTSSYLGGPRLPPDLETGRLSLEPGDRVVLATDGLPECIYGRPTLGPPRIGELAAQGPAARAADRLVREALGRGGEDNVALVVGAC